MQKSYARTRANHWVTDIPEREKLVGRISIRSKRFLSPDLLGSLVAYGFQSQCSITWFGPKQFEVVR
jgi:hypothetical protein